MGYIKDLYTKKPTTVKKFVKKIFNACDVIGERDWGAYRDDEDDVLFRLAFNKTFDEDCCNVKEVYLEDFAIYLDDEYLELENGAVDKYLEFMSKIFKEKYVIEFFNYRNEQRNDFVNEFDTETAKVGQSLLRCIEHSNTQVNEETNNF